MVNEMIERCAEAVSKRRQIHLYGRIMTNWVSDDMSPNYKEACRDIVKDVIKAMREPTEKMKIAGSQWAKGDDGEAYETETWQAMLDTIHQ